MNKYKGYLIIIIMPVESVDNALRLLIRKKLTLWINTDGLSTVIQDFLEMVPF